MYCKYLTAIATTDTKKLSKIVEIHDLAIKSLAVENDSLYKTFDYLYSKLLKGLKLVLSSNPVL